MKTQDEIVRYYRAEKNEDILGFTAEILLSYLDFDHAKEFLRSEADAETWNTNIVPLTTEGIIAEMEDYMAFAWGKAQDHRGISASRSVEKMIAWLWLLEDYETIKFAKNDDNYKNYGAPILKKICEVYEFPIPDSEDLKNMAKGKKCRIDCDEGCS